MKRIAYLLTCFLFIPLVSFAQTEELTLDEAVQLALDNNYQLKQAENFLNYSDSEVLSAKADFLPSVSASFNGTRRIGQQFDQATVRFENITTNTMSGSLSSSVTIFSGFQNIMNLRLANTNRTIQEEDNERLRETIIFTTASRFLQVILDQELLKISRENLEVSRRQLEQIEAQVEVGSRPTIDRLNQASVVANDELTVIQQENALEVSITLLMRIIQAESDAEYEYVIPDIDNLNLTPVDFDLQELVAAALENRGDLRAQRLQIEANEYNKRIARAALMPTITASLGINGSYNDQFRGIIVDPNDPENITREPVDFSNQFFDQNVNRYVGFSIQIPIFDNFGRRTSLENSKIALKNSQLELENVRFQINEEVRQAYNDYVSIVQQMESSETALIAAERAFETEQQRYEVGASTLIELNQANAAYVEAQSNRIQAIYNFVFQEKVLDYYLGQLTDDIEL